MERCNYYLKTKSILSPIAPEDGYRISIMSRHTLNDGITPHPSINEKSFHEWKKEFAPPDKLIGAYYKKGLPWEEFEKQYLEFLKNPGKKVLILQLIEMVNNQNITLLCIEETPEKCHRRLLAEECKRLNPSLYILIN